ncbi:hypothetical protein SAMN05444161_6052 [Rhizobiales bacterium GAS191]|nr:hypothetical protein SAMN05519104_4984 [Rhizobiales bacterium GAS188]SEE52764.1 hypothetical protein SAMN05444161_6052 [Rhizobiales bacterium GAS191]
MARSATGLRPRGGVAWRVRCARGSGRHADAHQNVRLGRPLQPTGQQCLSSRECLVLDIVFLALACALFLLGAGYAVLCDRL